MTAKRHLNLQIVILPSLFFIFILEASGGGRHTLFEGIVSGSGGKSYAFTPQWLSDYLAIGICLSPYQVLIATQSDTDYSTHGIPSQTLPLIINKLVHSLFLRI